jgi:hypothetical protein
MILSKPYYLVIQSDKISIELYQFTNNYKKINIQFQLLLCLNYSKINFSL